MKPVGKSVEVGLCGAWKMARRCYRRMTPGVPGRLAAIEQNLALKTTAIQIFKEKAVFPCFFPVLNFSRIAQFFRELNLTFKMLFLVAFWVL
jgi:hypothetical protein